MFDSMNVDAICARRVTEGRFSGGAADVRFLTSGDELVPARLWQPFFCLPFSSFPVEGSSIKPRSAGAGRSADWAPVLAAEVERLARTTYAKLKTLDLRACIVPPRAADGPEVIIFTPGVWVDRTNKRTRGKRAKALPAAAGAALSVDPGTEADGAAGGDAYEDFFAVADEDAAASYDNDGFDEFDTLPDPPASPPPGAPASLEAQAMERALQAAMEQEDQRNSQNPYLGVMGPEEEAISLVLAMVESSPVAVQARDARTGAGTVLVAHGSAVFQPNAHMLGRMPAREFVARDGDGRAE